MSETEAEDLDATSAKHLAQMANSRLTEAEATMEALQERVEDLEQDLRQTENDLARIRQELADKGGPRWRIGKYLQTLQNDANANPDSDRSKLTVKDGMTAINHRVSRTTVYDDFDRVESLVEDGTLPATISHVEDDAEPERLTLADLGELPRAFGGVRLHQEEGV